MKDKKRTVIQAVVFDWGGVIQRTENPIPRQDLEAELGLEPGSIDQRVFHSRPFEEASLGRRGADEAWEEIVSSLGWPVVRTDEFVTRFFAGDRLDAELLRVIAWLRRRGLCVGLLSNAPPGRKHPGTAGRWGMDGAFDAQVFSYQLGVWKPDPRMYRAILDALRVSAEETLFVDDMEENVLAARRVGMLARRFDGLPHLLEELAGLGLPLPGSQRGPS